MMSPVYFDDIVVGQVLGELRKGTMTTAHIMRWSAAVENWHRIHYDYPFATEHEDLPGVLINGSWKQHVLVQLVKDSLGIDGWLWKLAFRHKKMDMAGDEIVGRATVVKKQMAAGLGFVTLEVALMNQHAEPSTVGHAIGVLRCKNGPAVPYPFVPPSGEAIKALNIVDVKLKRSFIKFPSDGELWDDGR